MAPPARKTAVSQRGGRPVRSAARGLLRPAANLTDNVTDPRRDRPHSLPSTGRTKEPTMEYLQNKHGKELAPTNIYELKSYSNASEVPDRTPPDLLPDGLDAQRRKRTALGVEMYGVFKSENESGEELWLEFISTFGLHYLQTWPRVLTFQWC